MKSILASFYCIYFLTLEEVPDHPQTFGQKTGAEIEAFALNVLLELKDFMSLER